MLTIEILPMKKVGALKPMLMELADHHNQVAVNFQGLYSLLNIDEKIKILQQGIRAGNTVAAILSDGSSWQGFAFFTYWRLRQYRLSLYQTSAARTGCR